MRSDIWTTRRLAQYKVTTTRIKFRLLPTKKETKTLYLEKGATVETAVLKLGLYPDAWIAVRGDSPIPLDEELNDGDDIKLIAVVSGG